MLKRLIVMCGSLVLAGAVTVAPAGAQGPRRDPPPTEEVAGGAMAVDCPMMAGGAGGMGAYRGMGHGGMMPGAMMHGPMMAGPMMHGSMMGPMAAGGDPKQTGRMLQMRGDMLKAMGEVMVKHGKLMEQGQ